LNIGFPRLHEQTVFQFYYYYFFLRRRGNRHVEQRDSITRPERAFVATDIAILPTKTTISSFHFILFYFLQQKRLGTAP